VEFDELRERPIASLEYEVAEAELVAAIEISFADIDYCLADGETTREAQNRAVPVIKKLLTEYQGKKIVIGTHGNIMTILLKYFDNKYGMEFWKQTTKPDIYKLKFDAEKLIKVVRLWKPEESKD
jgi:2,3-bisphosphoglycerate-dependent phosphoglycerate mutase